MTKPVGIDGREQCSLLNHGMKLKDGPGRLKVAIAHDGALFIDDRLHTPAFRIETVVNGAGRSRWFIRVVRSTGPSTPVGVVGSKIVPNSCATTKRFHVKLGG